MNDRGLLTEQGGGGIDPSTSDEEDDETSFSTTTSSTSTSSTTSSDSSSDTDQDDGTVNVSSVRATDDGDSFKFSALVTNGTDKAAGYTVRIGSTKAATTVDPIDGSKRLYISVNKRDVRSFGGVSSAGGDVDVEIVPVKGWAKVTAGDPETVSVSLPAKDPNEGGLAGGTHDGNDGIGEQTPYLREGAAGGEPGGGGEERTEPRSPSQQPGGGEDVEETGPTRRADPAPTPDPDPPDQADDAGDGAGLDGKAIAAGVLLVVGLSYVGVI